MASERGRGESAPSEDEILLSLTAQLRRAVVEAQRAVEEGVRAILEACGQSAGSRDKEHH